VIHEMIVVKAAQKAAGEKIGGGVGPDRGRGTLKKGRKGKVQVHPDM